jgi:TRAP transporter TAXI family solute receptor
MKDSPARRLLAPVKGTLLVVVVVLVVAVVAAATGAGRRRQALAPPHRITFLAWTQPGGLTADVAAHFNNTIPGVRVEQQLTPGSFYVASALQGGRGDLGFAQADVIYLAYRRGTETEPYPHTNLRAIAVTWVNTVYVAVRDDSPFHSISDLRNKRVGVGPRESSAELTARIVLEGYGLRYSDLQPLFEPMNDLVDGLQAGTLDGAILVTATTMRSLAQPSGSVRVRLLEITRGVKTQLRARYPFVKSVAIPARTLPGQAEDVQSVGVDGLLVCRKDLDEELVYRLTKEFFAALPGLASTDPAVAQIDQDRALATPIPLHPGAARYYREVEIRE